MEAWGQTMLIVGPSGVGKSNGRVQALVKDFLADPENGGLVTNLPLNLPAIKEYYDRLNEQGGGQSGDEVLDRILLIPVDTLFAWKKETESPFRFVETVPFDRFRLVIDEIADYYSSSHSTRWQLEWQNFTDQARHLGDAGVEYITQTWDKLPRPLRSSMELKVECIGCKVKRDYAFGIPWWHWYQLKAIFTGEVTLSCFYIEKINVGGTYEVNRERKAFLTQESFRFYESHSAVEASERTSRRERPPFERFGRLGTLVWFLKKNWTNLLFSRGSIPVWACLLISIVSPADAFAWFTQKMRERRAEQFAAEPAEAGEDKPLVVVPDREVVEAAGSFGESETGVTVVVNLIDSEGVVIDGQYVEVGGVVETGPAAGERLEKVLARRGRAYFSGGITGRLPQFLGLGVSSASDGSGVRDVQGSGRSGGTNRSVRSAGRSSRGNAAAGR